MRTAKSGAVVKEVLGLALGMTLAMTAGCSAPPVPLFDQGRPDLYAPGGPDLGPLDIQPTSSGPILLASGTQPVLDGVTVSGAYLGYHDGTSQYVLPTVPGPTLLLSANRDKSGGVVSNNAVITLFDYQNGGAYLNAWAGGDSMAYVLDNRVSTAPGQVAASADGTFIAWVHVNGATGDVLIRRRDRQKIATSPVEMRNIDLSGCATELGFYDATHLVARYCQQVSGQPIGRLAVAGALDGQVTPLGSITDNEDVEQALFVPAGPGPGSRIVWTDKGGSAVSPGALKSAAVDGSARLVLAQVPARAQAQLTLSPSGATAFYLNNLGQLQKVNTSGGAPQALSADPVTRIAGVSPDGGVIAVVRGAPPAERLSLIDTSTKGSVDPPLGVGLGPPPVLFTADSALALYLVDGDTLCAYPVRGPGGKGPCMELHRKVARFLPLTEGRVLVLHDPVGGLSVASVLQAASPVQVEVRGRDIDTSSPAGSWLVTPSDWSRLLYVKGTGIYMTPLF